MTKEEFFEKVNKNRYPKYKIEQIKEGIPEKDCAAIVCTSLGGILLAKYENKTWQQAHFTDAISGKYPSQQIYYTTIKEDVIYWTDGEANDCSRPQFQKKM